MPSRRRILYVTGSRAEFGLMASTLRAICDHKQLELQLVVTGMHLDHRLGYSLQQIRAEGWTVDAVVPWKRASDKAGTAQATGAAIASLARVYAKLKPDIVLVCGDRVEAFAAASAAHISGILVAHVHGGDRALGQVDDALRHAITKLAHIHLPATQASARRILRLGEDPWRVQAVGSPGNDAITQEACRWPTLHTQFPDLRPRQYAVIALHSDNADPDAQYRQAHTLLSAVQERYDQIVIIKPNNDPGCDGILRCWSEAAHTPGIHTVANLTRSTYLGLLAHAAVLIGNSSSGLIEAPALGIKVIDIGNRQKGRERANSVLHAAATPAAITRALARSGRTSSKGAHPYSCSGTARRIAGILAATALTPECLHKLIAY